MPYKGLDSLMDAMCRHLQKLGGVDLERILPRDVLALARVFPVLMQVTGVGEGRRRTLQIHDSQELRRRAFIAQRELLARLADQRPIVMLIDDLQWGDTGSARPAHGDSAPARSAGECCSSPASAPMSGIRRWVARFRICETPNRRWSTSARWLSVSWRPPTLANGCSRCRITAPSPPDRADAIARESGASPIFIGELVRAQGEDYPSQLRLDAAIHGRVSTLPDSPRRILEALAVARQPVSSNACGEAAGVHAESRAGAMDVLRLQRFIRAHKTEDRDQFEVYQARIADTVIAHLDETGLRSAIAASDRRSRRAARPMQRPGTSTPGKRAS